MAQVIHGEFGPAEVEPAGVLQKTYSVAALNLNAKPGDVETNLLLAERAVIEAKHEEAYATDPWYVHLYRTSYAYHGVHPFYMWYWAAHAMDHVADVVWVGGDRRAVSRLGFRAATTLSDALEMVSGTVGSSPSLTYLHNPPHLIADVR